MNILPIVHLSEGMVIDKRSTALLKALTATSGTPELVQMWSALPDDIDTSLVALKQELAAEQSAWIDSLFSAWIGSSDTKGFDQTTRLAAIRLLGLVAGSDPSYAAELFARLWEIIDDNHQRFADTRAWALYALGQCNLVVDQPLWDKTFGSDLDEAGNPDWLTIVSEAKVRAWAIYSLGEMVRNSEMVHCWDAKSRAASGHQLTRCRLPAELFPSAEVLLLQLWSREIDLEPRFRLVEAIGAIGGWASLPPEQGVWPIISFLKQAAGPPTNSSARARVAEAIAGIGKNLIHRQDLTLAQRKAALGPLVDVAVRLTQGQLPVNSGAQSTPSQADRFDEDYNRQREYLLALRSVARVALSDLPTEQANEVIQQMASGLLRVVNGTAFRQATRLRQTALLFLDDLASWSLPAVTDRPSDLESRRQIVWTPILNTYKLMLSDPEDEVARVVITNIVNLEGDQKAANYFVSLILVDTPLDAAMQYRHEVWKEPHKNGRAIDLAKLIRVRATYALGTIVSSDAHNLLVETMQGTNTVESSRARDALMLIGGEKSVNAIVEDSLQKQVQERFFKPMEQSSERGWQLLEDVRNWSSSNYQYALYVAITTLVVGILLLALGVLNLLSAGKTDPPSTMDWGLLAGGGLFTVLGFFGAYLWEPVKGLNKVAAEMSRLIMSFENYLGRMRLIGLGFAHAYTTENWRQLEFLSKISELSSSAMRESVMSLEEVGSWPDFDLESKFVTIPSVTGMPESEARKHAERVDLKMEVEPAEYSTEKAGTIIAQQPPAGIYVDKQTVIKVIPSTNVQPTAVVPDFIGQSIAGAIALADKSRLTVESFQFRFATGSEGEVVDQSTVKGLTVAQGSPLTLIISKLAEEMVPVVNGEGP